MKDIYAVLDIGSATIKLLVAESINSSLNVLFSKKIPSHGIKKGVIEDERPLVKDIKALVMEAETFLETKIKSVGINIPSNKTKLYRSDSSISLLEEDNTITKEHVQKVMRLSAKFKRSREEEIISVIPVKFQSDIGATTEAPIGKKTRNLIVDTLVITTKKSFLYPYLMLIEKVGLEISEVSVNAFSCAKEAFDKVYMQEGGIIIDIGYKTSTISFYKDGYLKYLTVSPVGGYNFTKAIAQEMVIKMDQAETYKIKYGSLDATMGREDIIHTREIPDGIKEYTQRDLSEILAKVAYEVMEVIKEKVSLIEGLDQYEVLIVGGGGELEMIDKIASDVLETSARVYRPDVVGIRDMAYVSCAGMVYYMMERTKILGSYEPSATLKDISNTMSIRMMGLTVNRDLQDPKSQGKFRQMLSKIFSEDED